MGTAILPAQDYLASYKTHQNRHSAGRNFHEANLVQTGQEAVYTKRILRGRTPDFDRRRTEPQAVPRFHDSERRRCTSQNSLAFATSEAFAYENFSNGMWHSQGFRSGEKIIRPQSTPPQVDANGTPLGESLSIFYAKQSYLQQSVSSRNYFHDAKHSVVNIANHEAKGRKFSQQSKHIVMEKVTILKRGETLKSKEPDKKSQVREKPPPNDRVIVNNIENRPSNPKKSKAFWASKITSNAPGDGSKTNQATRLTDSKVIDNSLVITSTERLGPDPSVLPKEGSGILQSISMGLKATETTTGDGILQSVSMGMKATETTTGNGIPLMVKESADFCEGVGVFHVGSPPSRPPSSGGNLNGPASPVFEMEKWAGPAYSNSPPPSSLPFPKFSMQQMRSIVTDLTDVSEYSNNGGTVVNHAPTSVMEKAQSVFTASDRACNKTSQFGFDASATQDLRRLLRLD